MDGYFAEFLEWCLLILICAIFLAIILGLVKLVEYADKKNQEYCRKHNIPQYPPGTVYCPKCNSINIEYMGMSNYGYRPEETKMVVKIHLFNPFKPLVEGKEKTIRREHKGRNYDNWHCSNCGNIFRKRNW